MLFGQDIGPFKMVFQSVKISGPQVISSMFEQLLNSGIISSTFKNYSDNMLPTHKDKFNLQVAYISFNIKLQSLKNAFTIRL